MKRLWRVVRGQAGYSLVELLVTLIILGTVLGGLTTAFVQGSNAELNANRRVQAQLQATAAFDRLRRDVHSATSACISDAKMTLYGARDGCASDPLTARVSWCAFGSGSRYTLYRKAGSTCDATGLGKLYADYLISPNLFTYTAPIAATSLAKVHVDVVVNVNPATSVSTFELQDDIVMRNSVRA